VIGSSLNIDDGTAACCNVMVVRRHVMAFFR